MKKLLSLILSAVMLVSVTACSSDTQKQEQTSQTTITTAQTTTLSDESTTAKTDKTDGTTAATTKAEDVTTSASTQATSEKTTEKITAEPVKTTEKTTVSAITTAATTTTAVTTSEREVNVIENSFYIDGTSLIDANGNEFIMRGINHPHSWYASQDGIALPAIAATGANTVRLVCGNGVKNTKDSILALNSLINKCKELEMIVILEVHDGTGDDSISMLEGIADYWIQMKDALIGNEAYVILNIANEWTGSWDGKIWRDGYTKVIPKIRAAGIKNTIMVDSAGWGQYAKCINDYGMEVFESDPMANTMFSIHMYGSAGKTARTIEKNLKYATDQGLCVVVGEFGYTHSDGDVDEAHIMEYCTESGIGYLGWSWKGNSGGVEYLDIALDWNGSRLSSEWGEVLINGVNGIRATSRKCSVFN